jgi:hypothetical protein
MPVEAIGKPFLFQIKKKKKRSQEKALAFSFFLPGSCLANRKLKAAF